MALQDIYSKHSNDTAMADYLQNLPGLLEESFSDVTVTVSNESCRAKEPPVAYKLHRVILSGETHSKIGQFQINLRV